MSKAKDTPPASEPAAVPVPVLTADPPTAPLISLPGPQAPEPEPEPGEPKRRRRRHHKPDAEAPASPGGVSPEDVARCEAALTATFDVAGKILAKKRGAHWALDQEETETLGKVWTTALAPYLPKIGAAVPWAAAVAVTWAMAQPRLAHDAELAALANPEGARTGPQLET